ncbi:MAG: response regulator [Terriglobia bacterium]
MTSILIADDHALIRRGLREILSDALGALACGEAENTRDALEQVRKRAWDLLIMDIEMPGRSGIDALRDLKAARPKMPILVLSVHPEERYAKRALKAGAAGYVCKEGAPAELLKAVQKVMSGGRYVSPALAEKLAADLGAETDRPADELLSDREFEVLRSIASGKTVSQIAGQLSLSVKTVSTYRSRILEKMGMKTNAELTHYAVRNHLVD